MLPPEYLHRHSKWLRLVLTSALLSVMRARRPGEPKTLFMLDEFFALGHLEIVSTVWALVRSYGIQLMPVLQDFNQLKKLYPDMWETYIGMCGAVVNYAPNDLTTADWLSRRAGDTTRRTETVTFNENESSGGGSGSNNSSSSNWSKSFGKSTAFNQVQSRLIPPTRLMGLRENAALLTLDSVSNVLPIYTPPYFRINELRARMRDNPYYVNG